MGKKMRTPGSVSSLSAPCASAEGAGLELGPDPEQEAGEGAEGVGAAAADTAGVAALLLLADLAVALEGGWLFSSGGASGVELFTSTSHSIDAGAACGAWAHSFARFARALRAWLRAVFEELGTVASLLAGAARVGPPSRSLTALSAMSWSCVAFVRWRCAGLHPMGAKSQRTV